MSMKETPLWTWHLTAGVVILILLGLHMGVMHLSEVLHIAGPGTPNPEGGTPIDWANVAARAREVWYAFFYIILLGAGLFHGLYGLRNIVHEMNPSPTTMKVVSALIVVVGFGLFVLGTWAAIAARTTALAATLQGGV